MHFLDFSAKVLLSSSVAPRRRLYRRTIRQLKLDLVVIGEVPLAGSLLELALAAIGACVPVVIFDNAYSTDMTRLFVDAHEAFVDGMVLTGLSSFHPLERPPLYCPVPPYVNGSCEDGERVLHDHKIPPHNLILVLGYEEKAVRLATSLLPRLRAYDCSVLILSSTAKNAIADLAQLPQGLGGRLHVLPPPDERSYFGLVAVAKLVIGKCGFMQVTEALALGSPFIGVYYRGCFPPHMLVRAARKFVHAAESWEADDGTVAAAIRMLRTDRAEMRFLHDGTFGAETVAADFLERIPRTPRTTTTRAAERLGYHHSLVWDALRKLEAGRQIEFVGTVRATQLRRCDWGCVDYVTCNYESCGVRKQAFLWGRSYVSRQAACAAGRVGQALACSRDGLHSLELDGGEESLPPLAIA
jgi:hypothetical protein